MLAAGHELRGTSAVYSERPSCGGSNSDNPARPKRAGLFDARRLRSRQRLASDDELGPESQDSEPVPEAEPSAETTAVADAMLSEWGGGGSGLSGAGTVEEEAPAIARVAEKEARKAELVAKLKTAVAESFTALEADGIPCIAVGRLQIGPELSRGAFGIVRRATLLPTLPPCGVAGGGSGAGAASGDGGSGGGASGGTKFSSGGGGGDHPVEVAVKTLSTGAKASARVLENFATEVRMGWRCAWKARAGLCGVGTGPS